MRTLFFWVWFVSAVAALGRLVSSAQQGLLTRLDLGDVTALVVLLLAFVVLGRVLYASAQRERAAESVPRQRDQLSSDPSRESATTEKELVHAP